MRNDSVRGNNILGINDFSLICYTNELCCFVLDKLFQRGFFLFYFVGFIHQVVNAIRKAVAAPNPTGSIQGHHKGYGGETRETAKCFNAQ